MRDHKFGAVALIGPPNAGKSTLLNIAIGQKVAIVTPKPQTTRNRITGILSRPDAQVLFLDTPGIHRLPGTMNRLLLRSAWGALGSANTVCLVLDAVRYADRPELLDRDMAPIGDRLLDMKVSLFTALNKIDEIKAKPKLLPLLEACASRLPSAEIHPVSARTGEGVQDLLERLIDSLPPGPAVYPEDELSTLPLRFLVSEIVREKLFLRMAQELPYHLAVEVEAWEDLAEKSLTRISVLIYVSQERYKGMVVGRQGSVLKSVGTQSRVEIEDMIERKVDLQLWVKVKKRWTENPSFMESLGLGSS
ncbi:MAG: GTPase Era [Deltaproteobacteria bacterium]|nr:GTPase Era [Deltaproteobacteria bacterium]